MAIDARAESMESSEVGSKCSRHEFVRAVRATSPLRVDSGCTLDGKVMTANKVQLDIRVARVQDTVETLLSHRGHENRENTIGCEVNEVLIKPGD